MKITLSPTSQLVQLEAAGGGGTIEARVWEGDFEGEPVQAVIVRLAVSKDAPAGVHEELERVLKETPAPAPYHSGPWPARMVLP